jgi:hypothetical protein
MMEKQEKGEKPEKRFDVRVPVANAVLLDLLAEESDLTGIVESRLIVQYATLYAQQRRGLLLAPSMVFAAAPQPAASNGHIEVMREATPEAIEPVQPTLDSEGLDSMFGDPD